MKEIWKDIKGYEGLYQVSNLGRVKSLDRWITYTQTNQHDPIGKVVHQKFPSRILTPRKTKSGYLRAQLVNKDFYIHRLVCNNFIRPLKPKEEINHIDGNKQNNNLENLEIVSRIENQNHAYDTNLNKVIEKAKDIIVNGKLYHSLGEAARDTKINKSVLYDHLKHPDMGFRGIPFTISYASVETMNDECNSVG